jgi:hypothetical protein
MADQKISAMPSASTLTGAELIPLVQSGVNVQTTITSIADYTTATNLGFGEIYVAAASTAQTTSSTPNTFTTLTAFTTNGASATGVTPVASSDKLTLVNPGTYQLMFNASFTATNNHTFVFRCFNSTAGTAFANTTTKNHTNSTNPHQVGFNALVTVVANQDVIVQVTSTQASQPFTVTDGNFMAIQLGD